MKLRWIVLLLVGVGGFYVFIDSAMEGGVYYLTVDEARAQPPKSRRRQQPPEQAAAVLAPMRRLRRRWPKQLPRARAPAMILSFTHPDIVGCVPRKLL